MAAQKKAAPKRAATADTETLDHQPSFTDAAAWTDAAREQYETALRTFSDSAEKFRVQTEESFASAREGFEAANERMRAVSADAAAAAREEMSEAVEFANSLARAKSVSDALEIQRDYWTKLFETRVERARAMTEASSEAAREAFEPLNRSFASAFAFAPAFDKFFPFGSK
ncbi:MAG: phasin family protein [Pseudomonadota bacterium]